VNLSRKLKNLREEKAGKLKKDKGEIKELTRKDNKISKL
jgi:hypothetical protein